MNKLLPIIVAITNYWLPQMIFVLKWKEKQHVNFESYILI